MNISVCIRNSHRVSCAKERALIHTQWALLPSIRMRINLHYPLEKKESRQLNIDELQMCSLFCVGGQIRCQCDTGFVRTTRGCVPLSSCPKRRKQFTLDTVPVLWWFQHVAQIKFGIGVPHRASRLVRIHIPYETILGFKNTWFQGINTVCGAPKCQCRPGYYRYENKLRI